MRRHAKQMWKLLWSKPDKGTEAGRSQDRYRRAAWTSVMSMFAKGVAVVTSLILVPISLEYLGHDRFGLWMTLSNFVLLVQFTDLGLGVGLQNALARCLGEGDRQSPQAYISTGLLLMLLMCSLFVGGSLFLLPQIDLGQLIEVKTELASQELLPTVQGALIAFGIGLPAGMIQKIYLAFQRGYWAHLQIAGGMLFSFLGVLVCFWMELGLPAVVFVYFVGRFIFTFLGSILFFRAHPHLRPSPRALEWTKLCEIFRYGIAAIGAGVASAFTRSGPALVIANRLSTAAVTPLVVTQRLTEAVSIIFIAALQPLWPAYTEAAARGEWKWVNRTFRKSLWLWAVMYLPLAGVLLVFGSPLIRLWTQSPEAVPGFELMAAMVCFSILLGLAKTMAMLLNGLNRMGGQATYGLFVCVLSLGLGWYIAPDYGIAAVLWSVALIGVGLKAVGMALQIKFIKPLVEDHNEGFALKKDITSPSEKTDA